MLGCIETDQWINNAQTVNKQCANGPMNKQCALMKERPKWTNVQMKDETNKQKFQWRLKWRNWRPNSFRSQWRTMVSVIIVGWKESWFPHLSALQPNFSIISQATISCYHRYHRHYHYLDNVIAIIVVVMTIDLIDIVRVVIYHLRWWN